MKPVFRVIAAADGADYYEYRGAIIHLSFISNSPPLSVTRICVRVDFNGQDREAFQDEIRGSWLAHGDALKSALEHAAELIDRVLGL